MKDAHLTDGQMLDLLYGVGPDSDHLSGCVPCSERYRALLDRRGDFLGASIAVPEETLTAQRRVIRQRTASLAPGMWGRFAPVGAAVLLVAAFMIDFDRRPTSGLPASGDDARVFQEVFDLISDPAPNAVEPIRTFFEERQ